VGSPITEDPIRFIGIGEKMDDLRPFDASEFVEHSSVTHERLEHKNSEEVKKTSSLFEA